MFESTFLTFLTELDHPLINLFFTFISFISHEYSYFLLIPFIYWVVHKKIGFYLFYVFLFSMYVNEFLKSTFMIERPGDHQPLTTGYSFPSGHVQAATSFWGFLIPAISKRWFTVFACVYIGLISFSRLYTGAHWPADVVAAILISSFIIYMSYRSYDWLGSMPDNYKLIFSFVIPIALVLLNPKSSFFAGLLLGVGVGYGFEQIKNRMVISPNYTRKTIAFLIGTIGLFSIYSLSFLLPEQPAILFIHAALMGMWITWLAPMLFIKFKIYERSGKRMSL
ncbi:phosphatase PAP2 family protein [Desertibacillus haloalkaliphilus]|uniref:phosphatase PAP2 family protein n=1 Tax=Desertibacillus haloalkaliphilus TaxID=1328930 RepID=UPI001C25EA64|nr:phosphatase PAP2 family protein [Desertibacillus haloalkaliphilus]MBU8907714.1 phosphatase PAP2 family protein [Desertibacillus haloalkaliphilus]